MKWVIKFFPVNLLLSTYIVVDSLLSFLCCPRLKIIKLILIAKRRNKKIQDNEQKYEETYLSVYEAKPT